VAVNCITPASIEFACGELMETVGGVDGGGGAGAELTVNVTATLCGLFEAPLALTLTVPV
jgi:hypothetical protein